MLFKQIDNTRLGISMIKTIKRRLTISPTDVTTFKQNTMPGCILLHRLLNHCFTENMFQARSKLNNTEIEELQKKSIYSYADKVGIKDKEELFNTTIQLDKELENFSKVVLEQVKSLGAYTENLGHIFFRKTIAEALLKRDGVPSHPDRVKLAEGFERSLKLVFQAFVASNNYGILFPSPGNSYIEKHIAKLEGNILRFNLDFDDFSVTISSMQDLINKNKRDKGLVTKVLYMCNPNNPTGRLMDKNQIEKVQQFAYDNRLLIIVDESSQDVLRDPGLEFNSFKKVLKNHPNKTIRDQVELISFVSLSKGLFTEQSTRACFIEYCNLEEETNDMLDKYYNLMGVNTQGQLFLTLVFSMSKIKHLVGPFAHKAFKDELDFNLNYFRQRSEVLENQLDKLDGLNMMKHDAGYYKWCSVEKTGINENDDERIARMIRETIGINVFPGSYFDKPGFLRFNVLDHITDYQLEDLQKLLK